MHASCAAEDACVAFTFKRREQNCSLFDQVEPYKANPDTDSGIKRQPLRGRCFVMPGASFGVSGRRRGLTPPALRAILAGGKLE